MTTVPYYPAAAPAEHIPELELPARSAPGCSHTDHKRIAILYIAISITFFFFIGGAAAASSCGCT